MQGKKTARRVKVVDGRFQYRVIAVYLAVILMGLLLFAALTALWFLIENAHGQGRLSRLFLDALPPVLLNDLVIMLLVILVGIFSTHRIAGPVYRIERDIERVLAGEKGVRVRVRKHDEFPELTERVNQLIERVEHPRRR